METGGQWHHAPLHVLMERGVYMVTAGTRGKVHYFDAPERRQDLCDRLHAVAEEYGWGLQAWAVLANHYHFVALSPEDPKSLTRMLNKLHVTSAKAVNAMDASSGRKVWHQFWDTRLTYERSYLARLNYVHQNPVHHRVVMNATAYPWCSAGKFESEAPRAFQRTVAAMPIDKLNVVDDF